jgi:caffeoyl-CoA O-methyltransferase
LAPGDDRPRQTEAKFTSPHAECLEPELWSAPDDASSEHEVSFFLRALTRLAKPRLIIETGSFHGFTTVALAAALQDNDRGKVISLELDPVAAAVARERIASAGLSRWATVTVASSLEWSPEEPIDMAFLDAGSGWHRAHEFMHLRDHMHPGTLVAVHDTATKNRLPRHSFEALAAMGLLAPVWVSCPRGLLLAQPRWPSLARQAAGAPRYGAIRTYSAARAVAASLRRPSRRT